MSAKLFVPAGGFFHSSGGEMFSPTQLGLDLSLPACFTASLPLSSKLGEDSENSSAAMALALIPRQNKAIPAFRRYPVIAFPRTLRGSSFSGEAVHDRGHAAGVDDPVVCA